MTPFASNSFTRHSKRTTHPYIPTIQIKRQKTPCTPSTTSQKVSAICKIIINNNLRDPLPNEVELSSHLFTELGFSEINSSPQPYILIANKLYSTISNPFLPNNTLSFTSTVFNQVCSAVFKQNNKELICINLPALPSVDFAKVSRVTFQLKPYDPIYDDYSRYRTLHLTNLERDFKEILAHKFLKFGQDFVIRLSSGLYFEAKINFMIYSNYPDNGNHTKLAKIRYIYLTSDTLLDFVADKPLNLNIIRQIETKPENTELQFTIRAFNSSLEYSESIDKFGDSQFSFHENSSNDLGTLVYPYHKLYNRVHQDLQTRLIYPGLSRYYCINDRQRIEIVCKKISVDKSPDMPKSTRSENYRLGVFFQNQMKISFAPDLSLQLVQATPTDVKKIAFKVIKIISASSPNPLQPHRPHISMDEYRTYIRHLGIPFAQGQRLQISLSSGNYLVETMHAKKASPPENAQPPSLFPSRSVSNVFERTNFILPSPWFSLSSTSFTSLPKQEEPSYVLPVWELNDKTCIHLYKETTEPMEIVRNNKGLPLEQIKFIVQKQKSIAENLQIIDRHLEYAIRDLCTQALLPKQPLNVNCDGVSLRLIVDRFKLVKKPPKSIYNRFVTLTPETKIEFGSDKDQGIQIVSKTPFVFINNSDELLSELNMGGIGRQINELIRRAWLPRGRLAEEAKKRRIAPLKGILLYGPPGTGKSTLAQQLGKLFGCSLENGRLQMITACEIFDKWVGSSEINVRDLFAAAREDFQKFGEHAPLHVIVIDELDAAFGKRNDEGNTVRNSVVNQFLGELQGLKSLDNVFVIGITNRKDNLDPAVIRSGRLGLHLEFGLPTVSERKEIFIVHTKHLKLEKLLHENVDLEQLAQATPNFSGADIKEICDDAAVLSLERLSKAPMVLSKEARNARGLVTMGDYLAVLEKRTTKSNMATYVLETMFI